MNLDWARQWRECPEKEGNKREVPYVKEKRVSRWFKECITVTRRKTIYTKWCGNAKSNEKDCCIAAIGNQNLICHFDCVIVCLQQKRRARYRVIVEARWKRGSRTCYDITHAILSLDI